MDTSVNINSGNSKHTQNYNLPTGSTGTDVDINSGVQ
jgi:hypothetical protein